MAEITRQFYLPLRGAFASEDPADIQGAPEQPLYAFDLLDTIQKEEAEAGREFTYTATLDPHDIDPERPQALVTVVFGDEEDAAAFDRYVAGNREDVTKPLTQGQVRSMLARLGHEPARRAPVKEEKG